MKGSGLLAKPQAVSIQQRLTIKNAFTRCCSSSVPAAIFQNRPECWFLSASPKNNHGLHPCECRPWIVVRCPFLSSWPIPSPEPAAHVCSPVNLSLIAPPSVTGSFTP